MELRFNLPNKPMVPTAPTAPAANPSHPLRRHIGEPFGGQSLPGCPLHECKNRSSMRHARKECLVLDPSGRRASK
jgi:hypothetical protein